MAETLLIGFRAVDHKGAGVMLDWAGYSRACPFDLHSLLPVPDDTLSLGPDHPDALGWFWAVWGNTDALRHVIRRSASTQIRFSLSFWSADWTPWRALQALRTDWPELSFAIGPIDGRD